MQNVGAFNNASFAAIVFVQTILDFLTVFQCNKLYIKFDILCFKISNPNQVFYLCQDAGSTAMSEDIL